jgi:hypothetical protein
LPATGSPLAAFRHQFWQKGNGFRAILTVEFPTRLPKRMLAEHQWRLAVEFSNWSDAVQADGS